MRVLLACLAALALLLAARPALAEERIALVIGNSSYRGGAFSPLANPANDARLMQRTLKDLGFDVEILIDGSEEQMEAAIGELGARLGAAGEDAVGIFFYAAGHGAQSQGRNYLIPVDARAQSEQDVWKPSPSRTCGIRPRACVWSSNIWAMPATG